MIEPSDRIALELCSYNPAWADLAGQEAKGLQRFLAMERAFRNPNVFILWLEEHDKQFAYWLPFLPVRESSAQA